MSTTIVTAPPSGRNFKTTASLQTKRHTASSVTSGQEGFSDSNEARYWTQKLGLGNSKYDATKARFAHPRALRIPPVRAAVTQQVLFGPLLASKHPPLAVVSGPRVNLYASSSSPGTSSFVRALSQSANNKNKIDTPSYLRDDSSLNHNVEPDRMVQTGGNLALCASFRNDGRLLAVGTDVGEVRVCDVSMRATLTTFRATSFAIRSLQWFRNGQHILAAGDDAVARIWNLSSTNKEKSLLELKGHGDVIRCTALWQQPTKQQQSQLDSTEYKELVVTGSYDHTVRIWNVQNIEEEMEEGRCLAVLNHGDPLEAVCLLKSDNPDVPVWLLSAGGTTIKVWNPLSGQCMATIATFHRKTITGVVPVLRTNFEEDNQKSKHVSLRILSTGLDGVVQFHSWDPSTGSMKHLYSTKLTESITSVATDKDGDRLVFGTVSGEVIFRMRGPSIVPKKRKLEPRAGTYAFFQRGMNADPNADDYTVANPNKKRKKLKEWDVSIKRFRYGEALDQVLETKHPRSIVGVLEELGKRRALSHALSNRDEESLEPLLSFVIRNIRRPHFTSVLIGVAHKLIDIYGVIAGESDVVDELFKKLKYQIALECADQKALMLLVGQIESLSSPIL
ncbi:UTP15 C terminal-domain containing protein [Nitzschia inconspicua]|uniref:UTP15 C terminal-domain containing protein n=1 Tax=Nitzschia inconspicua TaxID=303405 RepID=A0A9K3L5G2_9STRA|nr:UTP15 C terminal-domain containing protein [Nitzschia inconspicua]